MVAGVLGDGGKIKKTQGVDALKFTMAFYSHCISEFSRSLLRYSIVMPFNMRKYLLQAVVLYKMTWLKRHKPTLQTQVFWF
jgi:hypothetical protein